MSTPVAGRERRQLHLRAPITGLVLMLIVVLGTYWGWQNAFGSDGTPAADDGCSTTSTSTTTPPTTTTTPPLTPPTTTSAVVPAGVVTTSTPTTTTTATTPPTSGLFLQPANVQLNVYNATIRRGLANNTASLLKDRGFDVLVVQNDPLEAVIPGIAQIRASRSDTPEVRLLIQHVPGATIVPDGRDNATVDLVLGETFTALGDPLLVTPVPIATPRC